MPQKQAILEDIWDRFYNLYPNQIFNLDGKPLVFTWTPGAGRWFLDDTGDTRFTIKEWGVIASGADWEMTAWQGLDGMKIGADGVIWIFPRFDEFYMWINGHPALAEKQYSELVRQDPELTDLLYDAAWQKVYENQDTITDVVVYGWNPWAESSQLEPTFMGPYPNGNLLLQKTMWHYQRFLEGKDYELHASPWVSQVRLGQEIVFGTPVAASRNVDDKEKRGDTAGAHCPDGLTLSTKRGA